MYEFKSGKSQVIGTHDQAIRCVNYSSSSNTVFTGGWDSLVKQWDVRQSKALVSSSTPQDGGKIYSMSLVQTKLVAATSNRQVVIWDVRQMNQPEQVRESSLMHQTRCVRVFPDATGYALSSIEGRVAIEYFDPNPKVQKNKYAFKCHRKTVGKTQTLYPVNCIAFNPKWGTFATGGCDATINVWDGTARKRICVYQNYPTSIAAMCFNKDGNLLAIAASYTFEEGEKDHPVDSILIRTVDESEVKPKSSSTSTSASSSTSSQQQQPQSSSSNGATGLQPNKPITMTFAPKH
jgi:cell cycle arrest protein BUB3